MDLKLNGKVALVTGAGSQIGYGKAIALTLAEEGCDLVLCDIDIEGTYQTADEIKALGRKAMTIKVDVRDRTQVDEMPKHPDLSRGLSLRYGAMSQGGCGG